VASTCQAVRNAAVQALARKSSTGWLLKDQSPFSRELSNLCFGSGFSMWKGKIVSTGACGKATNFKSKNMKFYDNVNNNSAMEKCTTAKKFWVEKPSKVRSYTDINKSALRQSNKNKVD